MDRSSTRAVARATGDVRPAHVVDSIGVLVQGVEPAYALAGAALIIIGVVVIESGRTAAARR